MDKKAYLGDAVYIEPWSDGYKLTVEDGIRVKQTIYMDSDVVSNLLGYISQQKDAAWNKLFSK